MTRYSVNGMAPYFATLNEARAHSIQSDMHATDDPRVAESTKEFVGRIFDYEWVDAIFVEKERIAGYVVKVKEFKAFDGSSLFRWIDTRREIIRPIYADGSLEEVDDIRLKAKAKVAGSYGVSNKVDTVWFKKIEEARVYCISAVRPEDIPDEGVLALLYHIVDRDGQDVELCVINSRVEIMFGSAENGWYTFKPSGKLGKKYDYAGGPALDGTYTAMESNCKDIRTEIALLRKKLKAQLTEEELARLDAIIASENDLTEEGLMKCIELSRDIKMNRSAQRLENRKKNARRRK